jgi:hypothetical protein
MMPVLVTMKSREMVMRKRTLHLQTRGRAQNLKGYVVCKLGRVFANLRIRMPLRVSVLAEFKAKEGI